jgi:hypothetical protein
MQENNDIIRLSSFIKSKLLENNKIEYIQTEKYLIIIESLRDIFKTLDYEFIISNNIIRHIIINGDISNDWNNDIIIYLDSKNDHLPKCINQIVEKFTLKNINIISKTDKSIRFNLNILDIEYAFVIKEQELITHYKYFFEINQLEYDLINNNIINRVNNGSWKMPQTEIIKLRKLDFFSEINVTTTKYETIINFLAETPLIIFELIELLLCFSEYFTCIEIKNFFINLNRLLHRKSNFTKTLKKVLEIDDDFGLHKELIRFSYNLEEKKLFSTYTKYLICNHENLINLVIGLDIDIELFNIFNISYLKEFGCLMVFQYLIYSKKRIFREKIKRKPSTNDLLEIYMKEHENTKIEDITINDKVDFDMLDKKKFTSLKYLKAMGQQFLKFEGLLKMFSLPLNDEVYIKNFYNIMMLLFTELKDIKKHHNLKLAYIIKRFHYTNNESLVKAVSIFNSIIKYKQYNDVFLINDNFIKIVTSNKLNEYIYKKMTLIPKINENFKNNLDCIDIIDFQDTFILFIEFLYKNKPNYTEDELDIFELFETIFEASLCDMRSYRIFKNDKRRKKEKHLKKEKKQKKEMKISKFKIIKNTLDGHSENIIDENDTTESNDIEKEILPTLLVDAFIKKVLYEDNKEEEIKEMDEILDIL